MHSKKRSNELTILAVDDDQVSLFLTAEALGKDGYEIIQGTNGDEAVDLFKKHLPDLILLDVEMPGKNGFDACKEIRKLDNGKDVPIIRITGLDDTISVDKAYEIGATDFITKPINWSILGHRIRYILRANHVLVDLKLSEARLASAQRLAKIGNWEWPVGTSNIYWSQEIFHLLNCNKDSESNSEQAFVHLLQRDDIMQLQIVLNNLAESDYTFSIERHVTSYDQQPRTFIMQGEITRDKDGNPSRLSGTMQDITERREAEDKIRYLAYYDNLTGLPNRQYFTEQLKTQLKSAERENHLCGLLLIDIDRFKQVNDSMGHIYGDQLIKMVANRIKDYLRGSDLLCRNPGSDPMSIARYGGDEFIIFLSNLKQKKNAKIVADRIIEKISQPYILNDREITITSSSGIAFFSDNADDSDSLLKNADTAVHAAKEKGRNQCLIYSREMSERSEQKLTMENSLHQALVKKELVIRYQPQVNAETETVVGAEALIRWEHPEKGIIPPSSFINLAEETGQIIAIGKWVLIEACCQAKDWQQQGHEDIRISVNVSSKQFLYHGFVDDVKEALAISGLDPWFLDLELTEGALMGNGSDIIARLNAIKMLGVTLSLDDFGTGYSSLSYLTRFPLDTLKIDRSFISNIGTAEDEAIIKTIIAMAHSLRLNIISEGVETQAQLDFLTAHDTQLIQGYLFSQPLTAEDFIDYLEELNISAPTQQMTGLSEKLLAIGQKSSQQH